MNSNYRLILFKIKCGTKKIYFLYTTDNFFVYFAYTQYKFIFEK